MYLHLNYDEGKNKLIIDSCSVKVGPFLAGGLIVATAFGYTIHSDTYIHFGCLKFHLWCVFQRFMPSDDEAGMRRHLAQCDNVVTYSTHFTFPLPKVQCAKSGIIVLRSGTVGRCT